MRIGEGTVNSANVLRIMGVTLGIAAVIDIVTSLIGFRIPWYGTTSVLTLFMYACESDLNYQDRANWEAERSSQ